MTTINLDNLPEALANLLVRTAEQAERITGNVALSEVGKQQELDRLTMRATVEVGNLEQAFKQAVREAEAQIHAELGDKPQEPVVELLNELRVQRTWQRTKAEFDAAGDAAALVRKVSDLIDEVEQSRDAVLARALFEELPSYLRVKGAWTPNLQEAIERAYFSLDDRKAKAYKRMKELREGLPRLEAALRMTRDAIEKRKYREVTLLPAAKGSVRIDW